MCLQNLRILDLTLLTSILPTLSKAFLPCLNILPNGCIEDLKMEDVQPLPARISSSKADESANQWTLTDWQNAFLQEQSPVEENLTQ